MKIGIHQPYLFPYIGYFQLIAAVDTFVIADNMQYIKNGWINNNRTLFSGGERTISLAVKRDSQELKINQRYFAEPFVQYKQEFLNKIQNDYRKAPHFKEIFALLQVTMSYEDRNVASFVTNQLRHVCDYLGIRTSFLMASDINSTEVLKCQDWVLSTTKKLNADHYINSIGGMELYDKSYFEKNGIKLSFLRTSEIKYKQYENVFVANLSIIDVMMFNSKEEIAGMLNKMEII